MSILIAKITEIARDELLKQQEGHFLDFKSIDIQPGTLTKTLSAFANADGGELYVGLDEQIIGKRKRINWRGFHDQEAANGHIQVIEEFFPLGEYCSCTFVYCENSRDLLLKIEINKTREVKRASDRQAYLRRGAQNLPINTDEKFRRLKLNKGITSYETETINIDSSIIKNSSILSNFLSKVIPSARPIPWLKKQFLLREEKPTVAAALLFAEEPQAILPKHCGVKIYRYQTRDKKGSRATLSSDPITVEGCLYDIIRASVTKTVEVIENIPKLGIGTFDSIEYPSETLHEIITNAVLHRDYSIARDIQVRIFDNRIEVESPGKLPGHITEKNILNEQFARNGTIVRLINKFPEPPNKDVGEGLKTAFDAMSKLRLKVPEIKENENSVTVHIRHEPLASPEEAVMQYIETHLYITNIKAREITGITSENVMKNVFYRLRKEGLIERAPDMYGPRSAWQKVGIQMRLL